jgi:transposase
LKCGPCEASVGLRRLGSFAQSELGRIEVVGVEQWAEIRRLHFVRGLSAREISRRTGLHRGTIRRAVRSGEPPVYRRAHKGSRLDPFKDEIHRLLRDDPNLPGQRIREPLEPLGCIASRRSSMPTCARSARCSRGPRTFQRTVYRPGEFCQFDPWQPRQEVPVGHGQTRRGWIVIACLGYSRAGAGALVFTKETPDLLAGGARCLVSLGGLPRTLVWDRQAGIRGHGGRPTDAFAAFCGQLRIGWRFSEAADPQANGVVERLQGFAETNFEPGRRFANELDFQDQLDAWFARMNDSGTRRCPLRRPADRREVMAPLPARLPDTSRRWVMRVPPDPIGASTPTTIRCTLGSSAAASRSRSPTATS